MSDVRIGLDWWPPGPEEQIGEERAQELVQRLRELAGPIVDEAEADLRQRIAPDVEVVRSGAPARSIARFRFDDPRVRSLCVGIVYETRKADAEQNSIQLGRDGVLRWRRD